MIGIFLNIYEKSSPFLGIFKKIYMKLLNNGKSSGKPLSVIIFFVIFYIKKSIFLRTVSQYSNSAERNYMGKENENMVRRENISSASQQEDAAMKIVTQFFADELLPIWGIQGNVVSIAPTELVYLELKKLYQDFNLVMEDASWKHFEFQSTNEGVAGLKRFRAYEAVTSYQHRVPVTTYVLYSGKIRKPITEFTEGVNTYRIVPIIMQDRDANELITRLQQNVENGQLIKKEDLVELTLCPLMGGEMSQKDRIKAAFAITREAADVEAEDIRKIEAVIYTMAGKFLDSVSMKEIEEAIRMTELGRMLVEDGRTEGRAEGTARVNKLIQKLAEENRTDDILKSAADADYQNKLFEEFNL